MNNRENFRQKISVIISSNTSGNEKRDAIMQLYDFTTPAQSEDDEALAKEYSGKIKDTGMLLKRVIIANAFKAGRASKNHLESRLIKAMQDVNDLQLENIRLKEDASKATVIGKEGEKGDLGCECYRTACSNKNANYYNHSTRKHYCKVCALLINEANRPDAMRMYGHELCTPDTVSNGDEVAEIDVVGVEQLYDAFANWYHDDGSYDTFLRSEAFKAIKAYAAASQSYPRWVKASKLHEELMSRYNDNRYSIQRRSCYYDLAKDIANKYDIKPEETSSSIQEEKKPVTEEEILKEAQRHYEDCGISYPESLVYMAKWAISKEERIFTLKQALEIYKSGMQQAIFTPGEANDKWELFQKNYFKNKFGIEI